jgi:hypothetical protein
LAEAAEGWPLADSIERNFMSALIYGNGKLRLPFSNAKNRTASNEIIVATIGTIIGVQILDETQRKDRTVGNVAPV